MNVSLYGHGVVPRSLKLLKNQQTTKENSTNGTQFLYIAGHQVEHFSFKDLLPSRVTFSPVSLMLVRSGGRACAVKRCTDRLCFTA